MSTNYIIASRTVVQPQEHHFQTLILYRLFLAAALIKKMRESSSRIYSQGYIPQTPTHSQYWMQPCSSCRQMPRISPISSVMEHSEFLQNRKPHCDYTRVPLHIRRYLVEKVQRGSSILKAARELQVKPSTAKRIVRRYKETGTYFESIKMKDERLEKERRQQRESQMAIISIGTQRTSQSEQKQEPCGYFMCFNSMTMAQMSRPHPYGVLPMPNAWFPGLQ